MVQPASTWLYQRAGEARRLRVRLFESYTVVEITNLTAIRRELFAGAIGPACVIVVDAQRPTSDRELFYFVPKPAKTGGQARIFTIDPHDVAHVLHSEAIADPLIWSVLAVGGRRDLRLIQRLGQLPSLAKLEAEGKVITREGVVPGDKGKYLEILENKRYFDAPRFPDDVAFDLDISNIPIWKEPRVHSKDSTNFEAFKLPQLLIKQAYSTRANRFQAVRILSEDPVWGVICNQTYLSVRDKSFDARHINAACAAYNSSLAVYYLALTSSRFPFYKNELAVNELLNVPLPLESPPQMEGDLRSVDTFTHKLFGLTKAESAIVDDFLQMSLPDALRKSPGIGRKPTERSKASPDLSSYVQTMSRVLNATFGKDKHVSATIYQEPDSQHLPVRMLTLHFDWPGREAVTIEAISSDGLLDLLGKFALKALNKNSSGANGEGFGFQRVAYLFHGHETDQGRVRSLTIIKPDERRYWARSIAMRDADDLGAAILKAAGWKGDS